VGVVGGGGGGGWVGVCVVASRKHPQHEQENTHVSFVFESKIPVHVLVIGKKGKWFQSVYRLIADTDPVQSRKIYACFSLFLCYSIIKSDLWGLW